MLCTKPYLLYRANQKIQAQGYQGLGARGDDDDDGQLAEEIDGDHVRLLRPRFIVYYIDNLASHRNSTWET